MEPVSGKKGTENPEQPNSPKPPGQEAAESRLLLLPAGEILLFVQRSHRSPNAYPYYALGFLIIFTLYMLRSYITCSAALTVDSSVQAGASSAIQGTGSESNFRI